MYSLFQIAVFNPETGDIFVRPEVVAAKSRDSARNKAIAALTTAYNDDDDSEIEWPRDGDGAVMELDDLLDLVNGGGVVVIPFG